MSRALHVVARTIRRGTTSWPHGSAVRLDQGDLSGQVVRRLLDITVSIGCAELEPHDTTAHLIERVSTRLLLAKRDGRDRVC